jgi:hypothetical protein
MPRHTAENPADPRRDEVAKILAAGLLRFRRRVQAATSPAAESSRNQLDDVGETRPHAATGPAVNAAGDPEKGSHVERG